MRRPPDFPRELVWRERAGVVAGPWQYRKSRRDGPGPPDRTEGLDEPVAGATAGAADDTDGATAPLASGHRVVLHPDDVTVDAWAPSRSGCLEELVRGFSESLADTTETAATAEMPFEAGSPDDANLVLEIFDDVNYLFDTDGLVIVDVALDEGEDGNVRGKFFVAPVDATARAHRAVARGERSTAQFAVDGPVWRGHAVVRA